MNPVAFQFLLASAAFFSLVMAARSGVTKPQPRAALQVIAKPAKDSLRPSATPEAESASGCRC